MLLGIVAALMVGCSGSAEPTKPAQQPKLPSTWKATEEGRHVLVLWNKINSEGQGLAEYYASKRGVPKENIVRIDIDAGEDTGVGAVSQGLIPYVQKRIKESTTPIDYIVIVKGVPLRYFDAANFGYSVDQIVATMDIRADQVKGDSKQLQNPYFGKNEAFSKKKFGFYLVTRLDGYTYEDARALVDNSMRAKGDKGPYFIDSGPTVGNDGYGQMNASMVQAGEILKKKRIDVTVDRSLDFIRPPSPLMGYCSWGSNDKSFSQESYEAVRFKPGALAETFVSTSGRTMKPVTSGQSVITDLIKNGVTGVKGYVMEPYTIALARPHILFDRYTSGFNLAESFYMASPVLKWRDVVFGDPLCRPYKK